jgi:phosphoenolpyruvate carboxykinase (ATP)
LENVIVDKNGDVDFYNDSITQNTRVSYPLSHIKNIQTPSVGSAPKNIFFLTADAFGVLPPISKLTSSQAAYHFISGYTAKIPGTEKDVIEPTPSFSACFGAPFMPLHPSYYAEMLSKKIAESNANVWMINTGWTGGGYGVGKRINLKYTRLMINAVLEGKLDDYTPKDFHIHSVFGLAQIRHCPGIPNQILSPRISWANDEAYYQMAFKLANAFRDNFKKFEKGTSNEIIKAGPIKFS